MNRFPNAAKGLGLMFIGQIVALVGGLFAVIPILGSLVVIVGAVIELVGLSQTTADEPGYRTAFTLTIAQIVVSVVGMFVLPGLLGIVFDVLGLIALYFVCMTTAKLLTVVGDEGLARRGHLVWTINLVCTIVGVVLSLLLYVPVINIAAALLMLLVGLAALVGGILYLTFLYGASRRL